MHNFAPDRTRPPSARKDCRIGLAMSLVEQALDEIRQARP
jgi:hypothetical protein